MNTNKKTDDGMTHVERTLLNSIWRPSMNRGYFFSLVVITFFPVVLFLLKHPTVLDGFWGGTVLLCGGLGLCGVLIGSTLVQLVQYWLALEHLLKRIVEHPLGRAFQYVDSFVRETLDHQISRSPHDLLRMVGCARKFEALIASGHVVLGPLSSRLVEGAQNTSLQSEMVSKARQKALGASAQLQGPNGPLSMSMPLSSSEAQAADELGKDVITAARQMMTILQSAWQDRGERVPKEHRNDAGSGDAEKTPVDALTPVQDRFSIEELAWLREAQSFVATVIAVLVNRHVRQFRYFIYTLTGCALLLLLAFASYPFEPHRLMLTCIWIVMGAIVLAGFWIFVELDRNTLLSLISGTPPGEVTINTSFVLRTVTWGVIPLLSVAAAQYPDVANVLFRWLEPFARALK
jgi:hypothetical protein